MGRDTVGMGTTIAAQRREKMREVRRAQFSDDKGQLISFNFNNDNVFSRQELAVKEKYYDLAVKIRRGNKKIEKYRKEYNELAEKSNYFAKGGKKSFFSFGPSTVEECYAEMRKINVKISDVQREIDAFKAQQQKLLDDARVKAGVTTSAMSEQKNEGTIKAEKGKNAETVDIDAVDGECTVDELKNPQQFAHAKFKTPNGILYDRDPDTGVYTAAISGKTYKTFDDMIEAESPAVPKRKPVKEEQDYGPEPKIDLDTFACPSAERPAVGAMLGTRKKDEVPEDEAAGRTGQAGIKIPRTSDKKEYVAVVEALETFSRALAEQMAKVKEFEARCKSGAEEADVSNWAEIVAQTKNINRVGVRIFGDANYLLPQAQRDELKIYREQLAEQSKSLKRAVDGLSAYVIR